MKKDVLLIICALFYAVLCIFSIVTGYIYFSGKRELNPIELSDKQLSKLDTPEKIHKFAVKMGYVTFIVGIVQGITAYCIYSTGGSVAYGIALGFTIFSIASVGYKLLGRISGFALLKSICYVAILIILILKRNLF